MFTVTSMVVSGGYAIPCLRCGRAYSSGSLEAFGMEINEKCQHGDSCSTRPSSRYKSIKVGPFTSPAFSLQLRLIRVLNTVVLVALGISYMLPGFSGIQKSSLVAYDTTYEVFVPERWHGESRISGSDTNHGVLVATFGKPSDMIWFFLA